MPTMVADTETAIHAANRGGDGRRFSVNKAVPNTQMQRTSPHAICSFQNG